MNGTVCLMFLVPMFTLTFIFHRLDINCVPRVMINVWKSQSNNCAFIAIVYHNIRIVTTVINQCGIFGILKMDLVVPNTTIEFQSPSAALTSITTETSFYNVSIRSCDDSSWKSFLKSADSILISIRKKVSPYSVASTTL